MAKKTPYLQYYDVAAYGSHIFFTRFVEFVVARLTSSGARIGHYSFLSHAIPDLHEVAPDLRGKPVDWMRKVIPLSGIAFLKNDMNGNKASLKPGARDSLYCFKRKGGSVYCGTITMISAEYGRVIPLQISFVASASEGASFAFLEEYYAARRDRLKHKRAILNFSGERVEDFRPMDWDEIILPGNMRADIRGEIEDFFSSRKMYDEHGISWKRGILLAGPPGNGKTAICRAVASTASVPIIYCTASEGDVFGILNSVHSTMTQYAPCVVIFEDADGLGYDMPRSALLNILDGMFSCEGVLVIATTNMPEKLDSALTGRPSRFDSLILLPNPGPKERRDILLLRLGKKGKLPDRMIDKAVGDMEGMSAACIQEVATCALRAAFSARRGIRAEDLVAAIEKVQKHVQASNEGIENVGRSFAGFSQPRIKHMKLAPGVPEKLFLP